MAKYKKVLATILLILLVLSPLSSILYFSSKDNERPQLNLRVAYAKEDESTTGLSDEAQKFQDEIKIPCAESEIKWYHWIIPWVGAGKKIKETFSLARILCNAQNIINSMFVKMIDFFAGIMSTETE